MFKPTYRNLPICSCSDMTCVFPQIKFWYVLVRWIGWNLQGKICRLSSRLSLFVGTPPLVNLGVVFIWVWDLKTEFYSTLSIKLTWSPYTHQYLVCLVPISIDCPPVLAMEIIQKRSPILRQVWPTHFGPALLRRPVLQRRGARGGRLCPADCEAASGGSAGAGRGGEVTRWMGDRCGSLGLDIIYIYIHIHKRYIYIFIYLFI